ncbi:MAG: DnaJ domain-containing protein [Nitrospinae bacterium]|nr:DnaJ domain-containing protein [Nitrospinota bacterium]
MRLSECYSTLNVTPDSAWVEVKRSYHYLAKKYHPDVNAGKQGLSYKFRKINHAFKTLEASYKATSSKANVNNNEIRKPSISRAVPTRNSAPSKPTKPLVAVPHKNSLTQLDAYKRHESGKIFGLGNGLRSLRQTLFEWEKTLFLLDTNKNIHIKKRLASQANIVRIKKGEDTFQVRIPPGPWTRMFIRIPDKGNKSLFSKKRGDLLLNIHVPNNEALSPTNPTFYYKVRIPKESLGKYKVWTLKSTDGPIRFTLPANTAEGQKFTLKANSGESTCSSHIITVHLV